MSNPLFESLRGLPPAAKPAVRVYVAAVNSSHAEAAAGPLRRAGAVVVSTWHDAEMSTSDPFSVREKVAKNLAELRTADVVVVAGILLGWRAFEAAAGLAHGKRVLAAAPVYPFPTAWGVEEYAGESDLLAKLGLPVPAVPVCTGEGWLPWATW